KADVATNQAVHWSRTFHVDLRIDDCLHLVRRFTERERMFKFRLPFCVRSERVTRMRFPLRLDGKHFPGVIKYGSRCFYFSVGPSSVAERAERRRFFPCANVAGNQIRLLEWNIELGFVCKLENQYLLWLPLLL